jgi:hypothetical protein
MKIELEIVHRRNSSFRLLHTKLQAEDFSGDIITTRNMKLFHVRAAADRDMSEIISAIIKMGISFY